MQQPFSATGWIVMRYRKANAWRIKPDNETEDDPIQQYQQSIALVLKQECDAYSAAVDGVAWLGSASVLVDPTINLGETLSAGDGTTVLVTRVMTGTFLIDDVELDFSTPGKGVFTLSVRRIPAGGYVDYDPEAVV